MSDKAREWLETHPKRRRAPSPATVHRARFVSGALDDGTEVLIDRRAAAKLTARFGLTVRGIGPLRHLDLDLEREAWRKLLYD